jgi:hypothetical protein
MSFFSKRKRGTLAETAGPDDTDQSRRTPGSVDKSEPPNNVSVEQGRGERGPDDTAGIPPANRATAKTGVIQRPKHRSAIEHAELLIEFVLSHKFNGINCLATEAFKDLYRAMCEQKGLWPRPWNPVASEYRKRANSGWKYYRTMVFDDPTSVDKAIVRRMRVFYLPEQPKTSDSSED